MKADKQTERALSTWKRHYLNSRRASLDLDLARSVVKQLFAAHGVDHIISSLGTIALRAPVITTVTDWEKLARKLLPREVIEKHVEDFTTTTVAAPVLAAPSGWSAEAGC